MKGLLKAVQKTTLEHYLLNSADNKAWEVYNFRVIDGLTRGEFHRQAQALVDEDAYLKNVCGDLEKVAHA